MGMWCRFNVHACKTAFNRTWLIVHTHSQRFYYYCLDSFEVMALRLGTITKRKASLRFGVGMWITLGCGFGREAE